MEKNPLSKSELRLLKEVVSLRKDGSKQYFSKLTTFYSQRLKQLKKGTAYKNVRTPYQDYEVKINPIQLEQLDDYSLNESCGVTKFQSVDIQQKYDNLQKCLAMQKEFEQEEQQ